MKALYRVVSYLSVCLEVGDEGIYVILYFSIFLLGKDVRDFLFLLFIFF